MRIADLEDFEELPSVTLIEGPDLNLDWVVRKFNILPWDVFRVEVLTVDSSRSLKDFCSSASRGNFKLAVVSIDGGSTAAKHSILTLLESVPQAVKLILTSNKPVLDTIKSRSAIFKESSSNDSSAKTQVLKVLAAAKLKDLKLLDLSLKDWDQRCQELLKVWALEAMSHRFMVFSIKEIEALDFKPEFPAQVLTALQVLKSSKFQWSTRSIMLTQMGM
jgi:DNA polymerase III delta prime subunit